MTITLSLFLSGLVLPLTFFPSTLRTVAHALPFSAVMQTPIDVWLGKSAGLSLVAAIALQVLWALVLLGLCRFALRRGTRKLVIQGG